MECNNRKPDSDCPKCGYLTSICVCERGDGDTKVERATKEESLCCETNCKCVQPTNPESSQRANISNNPPAECCNNGARESDFRKPDSDCPKCGCLACICVCGGGDGDTKVVKATKEERLCCETTCKYVQPKIPESFKPANTWRRPVEPFDSNTVYKLSYFACGIDRPEPFKAFTNIGRATGKFEGDTVHRLSYLPNCGYKRAEPIKPPDRPKYYGEQCTITTHKHDYVPKPSSRMVPVIPEGNIGRATAAPEKETIHRLSYLPNDVRCNRPPKSLKPSNVYRRPLEKAESDTIYKMSYLPVCAPPKPDMPWAKATRHSDPYAPIEKDTIYRLSYIPSITKRTAPMTPPPGMKMFDGPAACETVYKLSYLPTASERPDQIRPPGNLAPASGPPEKDTTYKLSYMGTCQRPVSPIKPRSNNLRMSGEVETCTTNRHDYTPKSAPRPALMTPSSDYKPPSGEPPKETIYKLSYLGPCGIKPPPAIKPENRRVQPPMESHDTTYRLSYMNVPVQSKPLMPWADRAVYRRPTIKMENDTIHRMSYQPPGQYICECKCVPCVCICAEPFKMETTCNCNFPKASC